MKAKTALQPALCHTLHPHSPPAGRNERTDGRRLYRSHVSCLRLVTFMRLHTLRGIILQKKTSMR